MLIMCMIVMTVIVIMIVCFDLGLDERFPEEGLTTHHAIIIDHAVSAFARHAYHRHVESLQSLPRFGHGIDGRNGISIAVNEQDLRLAGDLF